MERIDRMDDPKIRYNSTKEDDQGMQEIGGEFMPPAYAGNEKAEMGHGGIDYAMLDHFFTAMLEGKGAPISLKEGLRMTLPGIYAEMSARRGGEVIRMTYPWDEDFSTEM